MRRSSERCRRSTRPWRSTRPTKPVAAVGAEVEDVGDARPSAAGPRAEQEQQPELAEGQVADGRRRHDAAACPEDLEQVGGDGGQAGIGSDWFRHTRIVRVDVKYRQARACRPQQGLPALPRWSGVSACSHTSFDDEPVVALDQQQDVPDERDGQDDARPSTDPPAVGPGRAGRRRRSMIDGATM